MELASRDSHLTKLQTYVGVKVSKHAGATDKYSNAVERCSGAAGVSRGDSLSPPRSRNRGGICVLQKCTCCLFSRTSEVHFLLIHKIYQIYLVYQLVLNIPTLGYSAPCELQPLSSATGRNPCARLPDISSIFSRRCRIRMNFTAPTD